jgi:hypothetical protein
MILIGYGPDSVHLVDAYSGQTQTYWLSTFLGSWSVLGNMAVFGSGDGSGDSPPPAAASGDSYTVQRGDYLVELADRFGTTWQDLAQLNSIAYPYTIYPGQVLQLPGGEEQQAEPEAPPEPVVQPPIVLNAAFLMHLPLVYGADISQVAPPVVVAPTGSTLPDTFTVQRLDSLVIFGQAIGVDWRNLAVLNNIHYPFVIFPGEVLRLR